MYLFLWETREGERKWETVNEKQITGFLEKIINIGVHPATVMVAHNPTFFHWAWKKYHSGRSDVNFRHINEEIYGTEPLMSNHQPVRVPIEKPKSVMKFGWLAPDGRFFRCDYGSHSHLADRIVGELQKITNPEQHLEDLGWAKVLAGGSFGKPYAIGMGLEKKLTDSQIQTLESIGIDDIYIGSWFL